MTDPSGPAASLAIELFGPFAASVNWSASETIGRPDCVLRATVCWTKLLARAIVYSPSFCKDLKRPGRIRKRVSRAWFGRGTAVSRFATATSRGPFGRH